MEGKGRGLEGKGAAGGVCACRAGFRGVLMRSAGRGAAGRDPQGARSRRRKRRTCYQGKRQGIKEQGHQCWDVGEAMGMGQHWQGDVTGH